MPANPEQSVADYRALAAGYDRRTRLINALCGSMLWPGWAWPVNWYLRATHRRYLTNLENFERPWAKIAPRLEDFRASRRGPGWRYLARGLLRDLRRGR